MASTYKVGRGSAISPLGWVCLGENSSAELFLDLVEKGCNPFKRMEIDDYPSPFHLAIRNDSLMEDVVRLRKEEAFCNILISRGRRVLRNCKNILGQNLAHAAAVSGRLWVLQKLRNICPELLTEGDVEMRTPLHLAVLFGQLDMVTYLAGLDGIQIDARTSSGETPLHMACRENSRPAVEILLRSRADVNIQDANFHIPLDVAIDSGHGDTDNLILGENEFPDADVAQSQVTLENPSGSSPTEITSKQLKSSRNFECLVCMDGKREVAIDPCGHVALCKKCADRVMTSTRPKCPICRTRIVKMLRVFVSL